MFLDEYNTTQKQSSSYMSAVYGWMAAALSTTALTSYYIAHSPLFFAIITKPSLMLLLILGQFLLVLGLTFLINSISFVTALMLFLIYSFSLGITLSSIFFVYTQASIISAFLSSALMFLVMSLYGYFTKSNLTTMGNISLMLLFGLIISMVVNMFVASSQFDYIISIVGTILFVLLTAYDTQKIKSLMESLRFNDEQMNKITLIAALTLYLDFINLFLFMLRFLGKNKES